MADPDLLQAKTGAVDVTALEANAAMRSIVRRDPGKDYRDYLEGLARAEGIETPTRQDLARLDKKRTNKASNKDWAHPHDRQAPAQIRSYVSEPDRGRHNGKKDARAKRRCMRIVGAYEEGEARGCSGFAPSMRNAVSLMPTKAEACDVLTCAGTNIYKRLCIHGGAFNLGRVMRKLTGRGTPRGFHEVSEPLLTDLKVF